jgi:hypothetical protein
VKAVFIVVKCLVGSNVQWYKISEKCNLDWDSKTPLDCCRNKDVFAFQNEHLDCFTNLRMVIWISWLHFVKLRWTIVIKLLINSSLFILHEVRPFTDVLCPKKKTTLCGMSFYTIAPAISARHVVHVGIILRVKILFYCLLWKSLNLPGRYTT